MWISLIQNKMKSTVGRERVARMIKTHHFQSEGCEFESPKEKEGRELLESVKKDPPFYQSNILKIN